ncbi:hypothetical protein ACFL5O_06580 [Myxococcota bacterium]
MRRRQFLGFLAGVLSVVVPGGARWSSVAGTARAADGLGDRQLARRLIGLLRARSKAGLLGKMVLWRRSVTPTTAELVEQVLPDWTQAQRSGSRKWQLRRAVKARVSADFAALRMVNVGGWLLSRTEANVAVLAALERSPPG